MGKAREWWIETHPQKDHKWPQVYETNVGEGAIHVIEYQAFEDLKHDYDVLFESYKKQRGMEVLKERDALVAQLSDLKREVLKLRDALSCVKQHDYGVADLFDTMKNTVDCAAEAFDAFMAEQGETK